MYNIIQYIKISLLGGDLARFGGQVIISEDSAASFLYSEDKGSRFFQNIGTYIQTTSKKTIFFIFTQVRTLNLT
jgi:hypothetical protein